MSVFEAIVNSYANKSVQDTYRVIAVCRTLGAEGRADASVFFHNADDVLKVN